MVWTQWPCTWQDTQRILDQAVSDQLRCCQWKLQLLQIHTCKEIEIHSAALTPYCHLCPVCLYIIYPHYLINGTIFEKKLVNIKRVFWFLLQLLSGTFLFLRTIYRVSQEECARLRENVPNVKVHRYNPKRLYPKLNGYGDNGQRSLKVWQLLHTYWLPNSH